MGSSKVSRLLCLKPFTLPYSSNSLTSVLFHNGDNLNILLCTVHLNTSIAFLASFVCLQFKTILSVEITFWIRSVIVFGFARLVFGFEILQVNMGRLLTIVAEKVDHASYTRHPIWERFLSKFWVLSTPYVGKNKAPEISLGGFVISHKWKNTDPESEIWI